MDNGDLSKGGYTGLQTDGNGKRAIYSQFGGINGYGPGVSEPFGGEGTGWQTYIPFGWVAGDSYVPFVYYDYSTNDGGSWFTTTITDVNAHTYYDIGTIEIPQSYQSIYPYDINNFVEWYGPYTYSCSTYPYSNVDFSTPYGTARAGGVGVYANRRNPPSATPYGNQCSVVYLYSNGMEHVNGT